MKTVAPPKKRVRIRTGFFGLAAGLAFAAATPAHAITLTFDRITTNSSSDYTGLVSAEVIDQGTGVLFLVTLDSAPPTGDIRNIYFEDTGGLFSSMDFSAAFTPIGPTPVAFSSPSNPATPPGVGSFTATFSFDADTPMPQNTAINNGETGAFVATYSGGTSFGNVEQALVNGTLRVGVHMQGLDPNGTQSDSYVSQPPDDPTIPEPDTTLLAAIGVCLILRRRR